MGQHPLHLVDCRGELALDHGCDYLGLALPVNFLARHYEFIALLCGLDEPLKLDILAVSLLLVYVPLTRGFVESAVLYRMH